MSAFLGSAVVGSTALLIMSAMFDLSRLSRGAATTLLARGHLSNNALGSHERRPAARPAEGDPAIVLRTSSLSAPRATGVLFQHTLNTFIGQPRSCVRLRHVSSASENEHKNKKIRKTESPTQRFIISVINAPGRVFGICSRYILSFPHGYPRTKLTP